MTAARQQGIGEQLDLFDEVLKATVRHDGPGSGGSGARACAEPQAETAWQRERALTRGYRVEPPGKPPWHAISMPGGVRGGDREPPPYSIQPWAPASRCDKVVSASVDPPPSS